MGRLMELLLGLIAALVLLAGCTSEPATPAVYTHTEEEATAQAIRYTSEKHGIPAEELSVNEIDGPMTRVSNIVYDDVYHIIIVSSSAADTVVEKLIVDPTGKVWDYRDYEKYVYEYKSRMAGIIEVNTYLKLIEMEPGKTVTLKMRLDNRMFEDITGYLTESGYTYSGQKTEPFTEITTALSAEFILSLKSYEGIQEIYLPRTTVLP